ncbi:class D sortase [Domibacillus indicus]|uniref:class D sortase n=1 Tax=Domibacillus indicus TaxID=1437523 RepID=UPI0020410684|nr:class D sortase [Domibacillus indicus]MCM3790335.1 class D sortase [Domibacillus indicus]
MRKTIGIFLLIAGLVLGVSNFVSWQEGRSSAENMTTEEVAHYNRIKNTSEKTTDDRKVTPSPQSTSKEKVTINNQHILGEKVGMLVIPKIQQKYQIFWGTDEKVLKKGVGMFDSKRTTPPGEKHTVLSGHRDTVFVRLGELEIGDSLVVEYDNQTYHYIIQKIWITNKEDRSVIVDKEEPTLTLTTCYPFSYVGNAPDRYIIQAVLSKPA